MLIINEPSIEDFVCLFGRGDRMQCFQVLFFFCLFFVFNFENIQDNIYNRVEIKSPSDKTPECFFGNFRKRVRIPKLTGLFNLLISIPFDISYTIL